MIRTTAFSVLAFSCLYLAPAPLAPDIVSKEIAITTFSAFEFALHSLIKQGNDLELTAVTPETKQQASALYARLSILLSTVFDNIEPKNIVSFYKQAALASVYNLMEHLSLKFSLENKPSAFAIEDVFAQYRSQKAKFSFLTAWKKSGRTIDTQSGAYLNRPSLLAHLQPRLGTPPDQQCHNLIQEPQEQGNSAKDYPCLESLDQLEETGSLIKKVIGSALRQEEKFPQHFVFYHGQSGLNSFFQDLVEEILAHVKQIDKEPDFIYTRIPEHQRFTENLSSLLREGFLIDHYFRIRNILLPVNLSIFGNIASQQSGESSLIYFVSNRSNAKPLGRTSLHIIQNILHQLGLIVNYAFLNELDELMSYYVENGSLLQICIPQDKINDFAFLSLPYGMPLNCALKGGADTWGHICVGQQRLPHSITVRDARGNQTDSYDAKMIDTKTYLDILRSQPSAIAPLDMDSIQARVLITNDFLLNPRSGVKIYRYTLVDRKKMTELKEKLAAIVQRMMPTARVTSVKDGPLSAKLAIGSILDYERVAELLLYQAKNILAQPVTLKNQIKAHDTYNELAAFNDILFKLNDRILIHALSKANWARDIDALMQNLCFKYKLETLSSTACLSAARTRTR